MTLIWADFALRIAEHSTFHHKIRENLQQDSFCRISEKAKCHIRYDSKSFFRNDVMLLRVTLYHALVERSIKMQACLNARWKRRQQLKECKLQYHNLSLTVVWLLGRLTSSHSVYVLSKPCNKREQTLSQYIFVFALVHTRPLTQTWHRHILE